MLSPGDIIAERYQIETLLGEGGLAQVWRVRHCELGSAHALKLLIFRRPRLVERLILEGRIQAQLRHPHIVSVTDVIRHEGQVGLLMEYVDGVALDIYLHQHGPLDVNSALDLFASILSGVHAAHEAGVLHRDLKPANIMLARGHGGMIPKVMDFGIAKVVEGDTDLRSTRVGAVMGTPGYLAPEQAEDASKVDQRADVFALGTILYEALSGAHAFARTEVDDTSTKAAPLESIRPEAPEHICRTIDAAMATQPEDRISSCLAFAERLFADRPELLQRVKGVSSSFTPALSLSVSSSDSQPASASSTLIPILAENNASTFVELQAPEIPSTSRQRWLLTVVGLFVSVVLVLVWSQQPPGATAPLPEEVREIAPSVQPELAPASATAPADDDGPVLPAAEAPQDEPPSTTAPAPTDGTEAPRASEGSTVATPPAPKEEEAAGSEAKEVPVSEAKEAPVPEEEAPSDDAVVPIEAPVAVADAAVAPVPQANEDAATGEAIAADDVPTAKPDAPPPDIRGQWDGTAQGHPLRLRVDTQRQQEITAEVIFFLGATQRAHRMVGTLDATGALSLREHAGTLQIRAQISGASASGTYARAGQRKPIPWTATWTAQ